VIRSRLAACLLVAACFSEGDVDEGDADDHDDTHARLDGDVAVAWSSTLDGIVAVPRSIALDDAGDAVALCGVQPGSGSPVMDDAWIALVVR
jgi:hypothetical protein